MGSSCIWTTRKPWDAQRLLTTGPPSPAPASSLAPAPPVCQVRQAYRKLKWDCLIFNKLVYCLCSPVYSTWWFFHAYRISVQPLQPIRQRHVRDHVLWSCALSECRQLHLLWGMEERQSGRWTQGDHRRALLVSRLALLCFTSVSSSWCHYHLFCVLIHFAILLGLPPNSRLVVSKPEETL